MKESDHIESFFDQNKHLDNEKNRQIVTEVNARIDQFAHYPREATLLRHRKFLHHKEGIEYFGLQYGFVGEAAARQHVLEDCDHIPNAADYYNGTVGIFGDKK